MGSPADPPQGAGDETADLEELRRLLLRPERERIESLQEQVGRFEEPGPESVSRVLPEALLHGLKNDERLAGALAPTVEDALHDSVKRDPKPLADAIFPVIGPAIRKAIAEAIGGMLQAFQQTLEHSLSIQGIKWRIEALRTGRSYAEVVLLKTLVYQVEQVFLIHRETGLLLQHVAAQEVDEMEADMVSSMLTAIRDFVQDSFGGESDDSLHTMRVGDRTVWAEQGPDAILAGVVRGNAPTHLSVLFQETLERVHLTQKEALASFDGDVEAFAVSKPLLEKCLEAQYRDQERSQRALSMVARLLMGAIGLALCLWVGWRVWENWNFSDYAARLDAEPGIVVTESGRNGDGFYVAGLRDPLAVRPLDLLQGTMFDSSQVRATWEPYHSFQPGILLERARRLLAPPAEVELALREGVLQAEGVAPQAWIDEARLLARALHGVDSFVFEAVESLERRRLHQVQARLEGTVIYFELGTTDPREGEAEKLQDLAETFRRFAAAAAALGRGPAVEIAGHTDGSGTEETNLLLSQRRAEWVLERLVGMGVPAARLRIVGKGPSEPARPENSDEDRAYNRRITLAIIDEAP